VLQHSVVSMQSELVLHKRLSMLVDDDDELEEEDDY
jgi:hypothetical protein